MIKEFFQEDNGNPSSMRLMCFLSLVVALAISIFAIYRNMIDQSYPLVLTWLSAAFGGKFAQKVVEKKSIEDDKADELKK